jgi:multiple sugar transport system permease protein
MADPHLASVACGKLTAAAGPRRRRSVSRRGRIGYLFAGPALAYVLLIIIYPLAYALWTSFRNTRLTSPVDQFVGLDTYALALTNPVFLDSLIVTAVFLLIAIGAEFVLGFGLALAFWRMRGTHPVLRSLLLLPIMVTPVTVGLVWKLMLNSDFGVLSRIGDMIGAGTIFWLSDPRLALAAIAIMDTWQWTPFVFLVVLAGLESLPREPFESAEVDGAGAFFTLRKVTLPLISRILMIALAFRLMFAVATFDSVFVLTRGGPARATDLVTLYIYREGFVNLNISYASAVSFLLLIAVLILVLSLFRRTIVNAPA